jgi:PAS domain S-box-containing protein
VRRCRPRLQDSGRGTRRRSHNIEMVYSNAFYTTRSDTMTHASSSADPGHWRRRDAPDPVRVRHRCRYLSCQKQVVLYACTSAVPACKIPAMGPDADATTPKWDTQMPSTRLRSDTVTHASSSADPGQWRRRDASETATRRLHVAHDATVERRRKRQHSQSPMTTLKQMPAVVVLERIPVPVLAIAHDGSLLFTNTAFAEMLGRERDEVLSLRFHQVFHRAPASESLLTVVHALADRVVELAHKDGSVVRALMSRSAVTRADDQFALAAFRDLTAELWEGTASPHVQLACARGAALWSQDPPWRPSVIIDERAVSEPKAVNGL